MADQWDAPNQQVVRPDQSHPSDEGSGGSKHATPKKADKAEKSEKSEKKKG